MQVGELLDQLHVLYSREYINEKTELALFAECLPGTAHNYDVLELSMNEDCLQLFMKYSSRETKGYQNKFMAKYGMGEDRSNENK